MNISRNKWVLLLCAMLAALLLSGCARVISKEVLQEVDASLTFAQILKDPEAYRGKTVLFGGDIIETQNLSDQTLVVVLQRPLGSRGEPGAGMYRRGGLLSKPQDFSIQPSMASEGSSP